AARGGGFQPPRAGVEAAVDVLAEAAERALTAAGATATTHVSACLANADLPVEEKQLAEAIMRRGWARSVDVRNDTFAVLRAGLLEDAEPQGVAVVCGAGINCAGMLPDGRTARFPAIGRISGDWGGGGGLAEEALWHAARAEDGRGEPTALMHALPEHFGLSSMYALIEALHLKHIAAQRKHELTPVLFATAAQGDAVARALVDRMADEVVTMSTVALSRLGLLLAEEVPVLLGGSVLAAQHPQLDSRIRTLLAQKVPKAAVRVVAEPPVLGSVLLGLDALGAEPQAHARARAHYETTIRRSDPSPGSKKPRSLHGRGCSAETPA
ncbi:N-acetylglucosamine kinase, partial [Streptomyces sp. NPDC058409]|uniref:N-acetylglucosamine kinase n=1 Tax=Streptomyces sp. NPDC058409 TaxID=3346484 RepID=UPI0036487D41